MLIVEGTVHQPILVTGRVEDKDSITHPFGTPLQNIKSMYSFYFTRLPRNFVKLIQSSSGVRCLFVTVVEAFGSPDPGP